MSQDSAAPDLLPPNATALERELAALSTRLDTLDPELIAGIWDAWRCPAALLPWLAWALSVDIWDESWSEIARRQAIADSPSYHRVKGSVSGVESVLDLAGRPWTITEWWQIQPAGRRGTAIVHVEAPVSEAGQVRRALADLLRTAKPKSRGVYLGVGELVAGSHAIGGGVLDETEITVAPYAYAGEPADGAPTLGAGLLDETLTTIGAAA